jgi:enamine deaminase RidA (YjgF/YER057c/UK114 family)
MKTKLMLAAATAMIAMAGTSASAQSKIERTYNNPTAIIAGTVSIPAGSRTVYLSGSTASPVDPAKPDEFGDTKTQTLSILTKMKATLATLGMTMADVVKVNVFLVGVPENGGKMDAPAMNEVFKTFFGAPDQPNRPARSTVQVAALGRPTTLVEIEAIAAKAP